MPKNFVEEPLCVSEKFCYRIMLGMRERGGGRKGVSRFSVKNFLSHSAEKFRRGTLPCFTKFLVSKNFMDKRGKGSITIFCQNCFVSITKNFVGEPGTFWCFRKFVVSKNFMLQRVMSRFSVEIFLSHSTEKFRKGTFLCCVS